MKYVMLEVAYHELGLNTRIPVIFPNLFVHTDIADLAKDQLSKQTDGEVNIVSAGFINLVDCSCYGKSDSLKLESDPEADSTTIRTHDYLHGM